MIHSFYSHYGTIIRGLQDTGRPQLVSFFTKGYYFTGYKAGTRITELVREGLVERVGEDGRFALYGLTEAGKDYIVPKPTLLQRLLRLIGKRGN